MVESLVNTYSILCCILDKKYSLLSLSLSLSLCLSLSLSLSLLSRENAAIVEIVKEGDSTQMDIDQLRALEKLLPDSDTVRETERERERGGGGCVRV